VTRAHARAIALIVACDIHPLNNSGTLAYVRGPLQQQDHAVNSWYAHWILTGLETIEAMIAPGPYAFGGQVTVADLCIVPQLANARRFNVPIQQFPRLLGVEAACQQLEAFDRARPERQPDAE
jgi:maleylacetoacetate isomerase